MKLARIIPIFKVGEKQYMVPSSSVICEATENDDVQLVLILYIRKVERKRTKSKQHCAD